MQQKKHSLGSESSRSLRSDLAGKVREAEQLLLNFMWILESLQTGTCESPRGQLFSPALFSSDLKTSLKSMGCLQHKERMVNPALKKRLLRQAVSPLFFTKPA